MSKEIILTEKDFRIIKDIADRLFLEGSLSLTKRNKYFLTECFFRAFKSYTVQKGWTLKNGKIKEEIREKKEIK